MAVIVRQVELGDLESVAQLLIEMDDFYGEPVRESLETKVANMRGALFGNLPAAYLLVAQEDFESTFVGIAAYSFLWPAVGTTRSLYLKELYVRQTCRRTGVGRSLMDGLTDVARGHGCSRVEWTTDDSNADALRFYSSLGGAVADGKVFYRKILGPF